MPKGVEKPKDPVRKPPKHTLKEKRKARHEREAERAQPERRASAR